MTITKNPVSTGPGQVQTAWWREERGEQVFVDYNRMARDQTIASAYSVRALIEATVSAPLRRCAGARCRTR